MGSENSYPVYKWEIELLTAVDYAIAPDLVRTDGGCECDADEFPCFECYRSGRCELPYSEIQNEGKCELYDGNTNEIPLVIIVHVLDPIFGMKREHALFDVTGAIIRFKENFLSRFT